MLYQIRMKGRLLAEVEAGSEADAIKQFGYEDDYDLAIKTGGQPEHVRVRPKKASWLRRLVRDPAS